MNTPQFKVYDKSGAYQAACKEPEASAIADERERLMIEARETAAGLSKS